jgi:hypothetical protein
VTTPKLPPPPFKAQNKSVFHPRFLAFAREFDFYPRACNVAAGWEKGKVERAGIGYVRQNFWPLRTFTDLADVIAKPAGGSLKSPINDCTARPANAPTNAFVQSASALCRPSFRITAIPWTKKIHHPVSVAITSDRRRGSSRLLTRSACSGSRPDGLMKSASSSSQRRGNTPPVPSPSTRYRRSPARCHRTTFSVRTGPCILDQERQVVNPVVLTDAAWINQMGQIVFGVSDDEICVCH